MCGTCVISIGLITVMFSAAVIEVWDGAAPAYIDLIPSVRLAGSSSTTASGDLIRESTITEAPPQTSPLRLVGITLTSS